MAHHHHPQLTAHSQLTTLSPGQIHYIQLPAAAAIYQDNRVLSANFLRTTPGITVNSNCLICLQSLPVRMICSSGGKKPVEIFEKVCQLLQVPVTEIQHEWSFAQDGKLPFCLSCTEIIQRLMILDEQIQAIQRQFNDSLGSIRRTIQDTVDRVPINDGRILNFRSRVLKNGNLTAASHHNNGQLYGMNSSSNIVPDMTNLLAPINNLVIQQETSTCQQNAPSMASAISSQPLQYSSILTPLHPSSVQKSANFPLSPVVFNSTSTRASINESNTLLVSNQMHNIQQASTGNASSFEEESQSYFDDNHNGDDFMSQSDSEISSESSNNETYEDVVTVPNNTRKRAAAITRKCTKTTTKIVPKAKDNTNPKRHSNEYFAPVETDEQGRMVFEGIIIKFGESSYVCGQCGASCGKGHNKASMRKVKIHIKGFHLGAYKCNVCDKNFTSNDILSQHIVRTHQVADTPCDICQRPIKPRYMDTHKFTHMNAEEKASFIASGFKPPPQSKEMKRRFECTTCGKMFRKGTQLRRHAASHLNVELRKNYKCETCNRSYTTDQALKEHFLVHHDKAGNMRKKMCKVCGKVMFAKALRKHSRTHIAKEDRPYVCKICGARLGNSKSLQIHEAAHDPNETPDTFSSECDVCGKMFKTPVRMRNHRRKTHRNHWKLAIPPSLLNDVSVDKPGEDCYLDDLNNEGLQIIEGQLLSYQLYHVKRIEEPSNKGYCCCTCLKEFLGEGDEVEEQVKTHIRSEHIGNFRCNICTKRMKNIAEILAHKRSEHNKNKNKNSNMQFVGLDCEVCKKPNIRLKGYKSHLWLHKSPHEVADAINAGETFPHNYVNEYQRILAEQGEQLSFSCAICDAKLGKVEHLYQHRSVEHPDAPKLRVKRKLVENKRGRKPIYLSGPCECSECGKRFATRRKMTKHVSQVHNKIKSKARPSKRAQVSGSCKVTVKEEILTSSNSDTENSDFDDEIEYRNSSQFDPEFKVSAHVVSPGMTLRRSKRKNKNDCEETNSKFKIEYIFPEQEFNELISEGDIKHSPQSSNVDSDSCGG